MKLENRIRVLKVEDRWGYFCPEHNNRVRTGIAGVSQWSWDRACRAAQVHWDGFHAHKLMGVCPRCGNGLPGCTDTKPDGSRWTHRETCDKYEWAANVCARCEPELAAEVGF